MASSLGLVGDRVSGQDVRTQNVTAAMAIANIVKSSLGPVGLDKMLVDEIGDVTITNDGATILKQLEVEHPAAKVLVELANLQDEEVGDGTTSVVIIAAELLRRANELVKADIHPTSVIAGFNLAKKEACKYIAENLSQKIETLGRECIMSAARTSMSSKIIGLESDFFTNMVVDAVSAVKSVDPATNKPKYNINNINILKAHGKSIRESELVDGFALNCTRAAQGMPQRIKKAKIAILDMDLRKAKFAFGVQVLIDDPRKIHGIQQKEADITRDHIKLLLDAGVNVVLTTQGIDDTAMKYFVEANAMAVRRCKKEDLKRIAKLTGGQMILSFADMEGNESVDSNMFGHADEVAEERVGDGELIYFRGCKSHKAQTIILRGANDYMIDEVERSVHDSLCVVKRTLESTTVVPGGGAVEAALSVYLEHLAETMGSREQLAVAEFAEALLVIPKTLASNGAHDSTELIAQLRAYHHLAQTGDQSDEKVKELKHTGLDLTNGKIRNSVKSGVLEPAISKIKSIRFATEAAITILRIDDSIKMNPKEDPRNGRGDDCH